MNYSPVVYRKINPCEMKTPPLPMDHTLLCLPNMKARILTVGLCALGLLLTAPGVRANDITITITNPTLTGTTQVELPERQCTSHRKS